MLNIGSIKSKSELTSVQPKDVQPNAVDLRVSKIFAINSAEFKIDEDKKVHRGSNELHVAEDGYWHLEPGVYEVIMENEIKVAEGEAGFVITRSTLNRNGVFLTSGLYDSGYGYDAKTGEAVGGVMAGAMHVKVGPMKIKPGTRIGQFVLYKAETLHLYDGSYGNHKEHDQKYK